MRDTSAEPESPGRFDYLKAVEWLVGKGCPRLHVLDGSMPPASLNFSWETIVSNFGPPQAPLKGLHVGNFLGVSLAYFTDRIVNSNPASVMVSIDPNIPHRGIERPAERAIGLLNHFGLEANSLVLSGYSLEKSRMDDAVDFETGDKLALPYSAAPSCTHQLRQLGILCPGSFDFAVIDGNHEGDYLRRELEQLRELIRPGGLLILDDVGTWEELKPTYLGIDPTKFRHVATDGRAGIIAKLE